MIDIRYFKVLKFSNDVTNHSQNFEYWKKFYINQKSLVNTMDKETDDDDDDVLLPIA